jgi:hypothetical protein
MKSRMAASVPGPRFEPGEPGELVVSISPVITIGIPKNSPMRGEDKVDASEIDEIVAVSETFESPISNRCADWHAC